MARQSSNAGNGIAVRRIAVLVETATDWGRQVLAGIDRHARQAPGWHIYFEAHGPAEDLRLPPGWQGDGVIARIVSPAMLAYLRECGLPVVNVSTISLPDQPYPLVSSDMRAVGRAAAGYFLERGFRHFAYLGHTGKDALRQQHVAFAEAVQAAGCACSLFATVGHGDSHALDWNLDSDRLGAWLAAQPKPLAVLSWNGGREIIHASQRAGLQVPDEIAVLNTLDGLACQLSPQPISSIMLDGERIGYEAARRLDAMLDGRKGSGKPLLLPPRDIVTRHSTDAFAVTDPMIVAALRFIRAKAAKQILVGDVAEHVGVSRRVLERRFMESLQYSPGAEIRQCRLRHARRLLERTQLQVHAVAERSGFGSAEYMAWVFKRELAVTPLQYRRAYSRKTG